MPSDVPSVELTGLLPGPSSPLTRLKCQPDTCVCPQLEKLDLGVEPPGCAASTWGARGGPPAGAAHVTSISRSLPWNSCIVRNLKVTKCGALPEADSYLSCSGTDRPREKTNRIPSKFSVRRVHRYDPQLCQLLRGFSREFERPVLSRPVDVERPVDEVPQGDVVKKQR